MSTNSSFLPEDYLAKKAERRTNFICLVLFVVVMLMVFLAFVFTNQRHTQVMERQRDINSRYQSSAENIQLVNDLDGQMEDVLHKAELVAALVEPVPRSNILSELVNRMPDRLSLLELELESEKLKPTVPKKNATDEKVGRLGPERAQTKEEAAEEPKRIEPPRYRTRMTLLGVAPTDQEVARYMASLNACDLLLDVKLIYTEEQEIEGQVMREFKFDMMLAPDADVLELEPLIKPRGGVMDPTSDVLRFIAPGSKRGSVRANDGRNAD
jgi:Tfp pilus assembly protein PilN